MRTPPNLRKAERFMWLHARLLDRLRFEFHFLGGPRDAVVQALRPYQTVDGGFGHALEPDFRGPSSQPLPLWTALEMLEELDLPNDPTVNAMVARAVEWLETITTPDGGVPFVLPSVADAPHAPWLEPEKNPPGSLHMTAPLAGFLHHRGVKSAWLDRATDFCWNALEHIGPTYAYEMRGVVVFLDRVPDRARAERMLPRIGDALRNQKLVALEADPNDHVHTPLDFAPSPALLSKRLFDDAVMERQLDALTAAQQPDGGWPIDWTVWTPITGLEWRGWQTVKRLSILRAYGRLPNQPSRA